MSDYGSHCERLAGYGVGSGELRDYEPFSLEKADTVEANEREGQTTDPKLYDPAWIPNWITDEQDRANFEASHREWIYRRENALKPVAVNVAPSSAIPEDAEETNLSGGMSVPMYESPTGDLRLNTERAADFQLSAGGDPEPAQNIPSDAEASLTEWYDEAERNQRENEREKEEQAWREQELLQEETDNT